ncbi:MAG: hypothetical protein ABI864_05400 [Chloroflexota bacterium]
MPPGSAARLAQPLTAFALPGEAPTHEIAAGTEVVVLGGPRELDGETCYEIEYPVADQQLLPWVRIAGLASLTPVTATCPTAQADAFAIPAWDRLSCLGSDPITVVGEIGHCQGGVVTAEPEWLAYVCWSMSVEGGGLLGLHAPPASGIVFPDEIVHARVTGHFDDAAASTCFPTQSPDQSWQGPGPDEQLLLCREAFVVDAMEILEVIGTPPAA